MKPLWVPREIQNSRRSYTHFRRMSSGRLIMMALAPSSDIIQLIYETFLSTPIWDSGGVASDPSDWIVKG
jgi:hypothetical protein